MSNKGQSLVELAISFTILMFLLSGVVEFSFAFFQFVQLRDAVQEGALYGSACDGCTTQTIVERVIGASSSPLDMSNPNVTISVTVQGKDFSQKCEADALEVRASYPHKIFMPFLPKLIGRDTIFLNAKVTDTVLYPRCAQ